MSADVEPTQEEMDKLMAEPLRDPNQIHYTLPDGRVISLAYDLCKARSVVAYTLADGSIVDAVICVGER